MDKNWQKRKALNHKFDPVSLEEKIRSYTNSCGQPLYDLSDKTHNDVKIQLMPDHTLRPATFVPSKISPHIIYAHPTTIYAVRKDLFYLDEEFLDLQSLGKCQSCGETQDLQFYHCCPFCAGKLAPNDDS